jgi:hypothetical protein
MGQKHAATNEDGVIIFYDSLDSPPPSGVTTLAITDEVWQEILSNPGYTIVDGGLVPPSASALLNRAKQAQNSSINLGYNTALAEDITFTTEANVTKTYDADTESRAAIAQAAQAYTSLGAVPPGFYWKASDNTQVPFELHDIQGLNEALASRTWFLFQQRTQLKASVKGAKTIANVTAVKWVSK